MMLTKDSPENLRKNRRYTYTVGGEVWHGIFRELDVENGKLVLEFSQFGVKRRERWCDIQGVEGEA